MLKFNGVKEILASEGMDLGTSSWISISQSDINAYSLATGSSHWLHVDIERASRSKFGGTIVQGEFTLALNQRLRAELYHFDDILYSMNYGTNRVRYPAPLLVGSQVRLHATMQKVVSAPGGLEVTVRCVFESNSVSKPVCIADVLSRVFVN